MAGIIGKVVCSIDAREYSDEYPEEEWVYLRNGVMIEWDKMGLILSIMRSPSLV